MDVYTCIHLHAILLLFILLLGRQPRSGEASYSMPYIVGEAAGQTLEGVTLLGLLVLAYVALVMHSW